MSIPFPFSTALLGENALNSAAIIARQTARTTLRPAKAIRLLVSWSNAVRIWSVCQSLECVCLFSSDTLEEQRQTERGSERMQRQTRLAALPGQTNIINNISY